jgi:hypothetical protein
MVVCSTGKAGKCELGLFNPRARNYPLRPSAGLGMHTVPETMAHVQRGGLGYGCFRQKQCEERGALVRPGSAKSRISGGFT